MGKKAVPPVKAFAAAALAAGMAMPVLGAPAAATPFKQIDSALSGVEVREDILYDGVNAGQRPSRARKEGMIDNLAKRYAQCVDSSGKLKLAYAATGCVFGAGVALQAPNGDQTTYMQSLVKLEPNGTAEVIVRQRVLSAFRVDPKTNKVGIVGDAAGYLEQTTQFRKEHLNGVGNLHITHAFDVGRDGRIKPKDPLKVNLAPYGYQNHPGVERDLKEVPAPHEARPPFYSPVPLFQPAGALMKDAARQQRRFTPE